MINDDPELDPAPFVGSHGHDWCCRPAQLGPPDHTTKLCTHWLIIPGPPLSCYLVYFPKLVDDSRLGYYHAHPTTWSLHIILAGRGTYTVDGITHDIEPGSVMYHGPDVPHCGPWPNVGSEMKILVVQHPSVGHRHGEWIVRPDMGTKEAFRNVSAFVQTFGDLKGDDLFKYIDPLPHVDMGVQPDPSARWRKYMGGPKKASGDR